jgi:hypothetical protein
MAEPNRLAIGRFYFKLSLVSALVFAAITVALLFAGRWIPGSFLAVCTIIFVGLLPHWWQMWHETDPNSR